jgi:acetolactate synthase-1/3 small subunit
MARVKAKTASARHLISILVENQPGVLARVAALFSGRGYNIDSLSVAETLDPTISRITCATSGSDDVVEQIIKQLRKLIDVLRVVHFPLGGGGFVSREMLLAKVRATEDQRGEVMRVAEIFRARVVDLGTEVITLEVTGDQEKIEALLDLLAPMGILEVARTGPVALPRGGARLRSGPHPARGRNERDPSGRGDETRSCRLPMAGK